MKSNSKKYVLFLNNRYSPKDNDFYLKTLRGCRTIAVDGGVRFFIKNKIIPDYLIGDFDSAPRIPKWLKKRTKILTHPVQKDKTDSQLAVELAIEMGANDITIAGAATATEIDHMLGNVFLLRLISDIARKRKIKIAGRLTGPTWMVCYAYNEKLCITGHKDDYLSIIPLSEKCDVSFSGLIYKSPDRVLKPGESLTLRNQFIRKTANISVSGRALVIKVAKKK